MSPRTKPKTRAERTEELRQSILDASLQLFIEQGYDRTTTRQILQRVGILNGSLYNIYHSKDEIFADIAVRALTESLEMMDGILGPGSTFRERFCFLPCMEIYASGRSPRIAELLAVAIGSREVQRKISSFYLERLRTLGPEGEGIVSVPDVTLKLTLYDGALGAVLRGLSEGTVDTDPRRVMHLVSSVLCGLFFIEREGLDAYVDRIAGELESREIVICGIRV